MTDIPDDGERCQDCEQTYSRTLWHAPDDLWARFVSPYGDGLLCPACFADRAKAEGMIVRFEARPFIGRNPDTGGWTHYVEAQSLTPSTTPIDAAQAVEPIDADDVRVGETHPGCPYRVDGSPCEQSMLKYAALCRCEADA